MTESHTDIIEYPTEDERRRLEKRIQLYSDVLDTFSTSHGRRVLIHLLKGCFMYDSVFTGNAKTHYNSALNDYGKDLLDLVAISDLETYLWYHQQRSIDLGDDVLVNELKARRKLESADKR